MSVLSTFFDASKYQESGKLGVSRITTETSLLSTFGQIKQYFVDQINSELYNNAFYHVPFTSGEQFTNYSIGKSDFDIKDLTFEQASLNIGFVNYRYV